MRRNEIAAAIHKRMCEDSRFGYSWEERWGYYWNVWNYDGRDYVVYAGDYDCSSSTITAWKKAVEGTAYEGKLDGATYTGNMRSVFVNSGLFEWKPMSFLAEPGDLYLNEGCHVAMCQTQYPDILSEFSSNEYGGAYGGSRGDQTGWESHVTDYYDYPWDGILHYNGKADGSSGGSSGSGGSSNVPSGQWQGDVIGKTDTTGADDDYAGVFGKPIGYIAIDGVGEYQAHDPHGWWPFVDKYDLKDEEYGMAGDGKPIDGLRITDNTVNYQVHTVDGRWHEVMTGTKDSSGYGDDYAGVYGISIDAVRIWRDSGTQPRYNVWS